MTNDWVWLRSILLDEIKLDKYDKKINKYIVNLIRNKLVYFLFYFFLACVICSRLQQLIPRNYMYIYRLLAFFLCALSFHPSVKIVSFSITSRTSRAQWRIPRFISLHVVYPGLRAPIQTSRISLSLIVCIFFIHMYMHIECLQYQTRSKMPKWIAAVGGATNCPVDFTFYISATRPFPIKAICGLFVS